MISGLNSLRQKPDFSINADFHSPSYWIGYTASAINPVSAFPPDFASEQMLVFSINANFRSTLGDLHRVQPRLQESV